MNYCLKVFFRIDDIFKKNFGTVQAGVQLLVVQFHMPGAISVPLPIIS